MNTIPLLWPSLIRDGGESTMIFFTGSAAIGCRGCDRLLDGDGNPSCSRSSSSTPSGSGELRPPATARLPRVTSGGSCSWLHAMATLRFGCGPGAAVTVAPDEHRAVLSHNVRHDERPNIAKLWAGQTGKGWKTFFFFGKSSFDLHNFCQSLIFPHKLKKLVFYLFQLLKPFELASWTVGCWAI